MPQMSPMMWFSLFILFSIAMIMFNQMNFFIYKSPTIKIFKKTMMKKDTNWKW
uniref:ATP synthase F0 subunit 8 n=1 Tax=Oedipoda miniata TaxID=433451 RepID=UPI00243540F2|nr:ATP synthase F0 subunit 8 [Oedipoda miniata]WEX31973.1 ATP synthase F0 subunit 8 [Oedipoda miniata]